MPSNVLTHCTDPEACHHCHITSPIPTNQLIKTHPLRSRISPSSCAHQRLIEERSSEDTSDRLSHNGHRGRRSSKLDPFGDEVLRRALFRHETEANIQKERHSSTPNGAQVSPYRNRVPPPAGVLYTVPPNGHPHISSPRLKQYHSYDPYRKSGKRAHSNAEVESLSPIGHRHSFLHSHNFQGSSLSDRDGIPPDLMISGSKSKFNPIFTDVRSPFILQSKEFGTQTSRLSGYGELLSEHSSFSSKDPKKIKKKSMLNLPTGLLLAGYALLIVIAATLGVVLSQRRQLLRNAPQGERTINVPGAIRVTGPTQSVPRGSGSRRVQVPAQRRPSRIFTQSDFDYFDTGALDDVIVRQNQPARTSASVFPPFSSFSAPQQPERVAPALDVRARPKQATRTGSSIFPPFSSFSAPQEPEKVAPRAPTPTPAPVQVAAPIPTPTTRRQRPSQQRERTSTDFRSRFDIAGGEETVVEDTTPKQPAVRILDSWTNVQADGSFSYGYINSDGSFKNETRGSDCVSRGVWGYIDEATGQTISHPYETGIPCDPNAPDYFYDYETGIISSDDTLFNDRRTRNRAGRV